MPSYPDPLSIITLIIDIFTLIFAALQVLFSWQCLHAWKKAMLPHMRIEAVKGAEASSSRTSMRTMEQDRDEIRIRRASTV
jgi:hypothetical protein